jgi:hypothetical protein
LLTNLDGLLLDLLVLRDDEVKSSRRRQKVQDADPLLVEPFSGGNDVDLIGRPGRSLCRRIEAPQTLHDVADELDTDWFCVSRGKHIDDPAANGECAVFVYRLLAREPGIDEQIGQSLRLDFRPGTKLDRRTEQTFVRAHAREKRRCRGDDQPRRPRGGRVQRARPGRGHAEMRRHASIGIDLDRGKRKYGLLDAGCRRAFEGSVEEARIGRHLLDIPVGRHDHECHAAPRARRADGRQRLACRRQARRGRSAAECC